MKTKLMLTLILLLLLTACQVNKFHDTFNEINELDKKYDTSFMKEKLNGSVVDSSEIPKFISELEAIKSKVSRSGANDTNASLLLIRARIDMLESEMAWQTANTINTRRKLKEDVWCYEADLVKSNSEYLGKAVAEAINATLHLDNLLAWYPGYRDLIGYNENKTRFYLSPTCYYGHYARVQLEALNNICYNASANATSRTIVPVPPPLCITP
ncbi:hypothetical protein HYT58_02065 [Candidatus Woesearchaeota archaeon]|nr:hypothetical protein [Candidatus Woesearchaeota archaeon]